MVHSMKMGWMKTPTQRKKELEERDKEEEKYFDLWSKEDEVCVQYMTGVLTAVYSSARGVSILVVGNIFKGGM